jgi:hypothetical protein
MPDRRFRDMSLTEDEVEHLVKVYASTKESALLDPTRALTWKFLDRAKRLLPLWRQWGLRDLENKGFHDGWATYRDTH